MKREDQVRLLARGILVGVLALGGAVAVLLASAVLGLAVRLFLALAGVE